MKREYCDACTFHHRTLKAKRSCVLKAVSNGLEHRGEDGFIIGWSGVPVESVIELLVKGMQPEYSMFGSDGVGSSRKYELADFDVSTGRGTLVEVMNYRAEKGEFLMMETREIPFDANALQKGIGAKR